VRLVVSRARAPLLADLGFALEAVAVSSLFECPHPNSSL
jgi:hypothetical protein